MSKASAANSSSNSLILTSDLDRELDRAIDRRGKNKLSRIFPDTGPYRRELYVKHMEFMRATKDHDQVLMMAANRCISPWTPIDLAKGDATRLCGELIFERAFDVLAWDGGSRCSRRASGVFLKGIEPMFRIHLDNGQFLDVTRRHRVLTTDGYLHIDQLIHASDGLHCRVPESDSSANYGVDGRPNDERPRSQLDNARSRPPSTADARLHTRLYDTADATERRSEYNHACLSFDHHSSPDDPYLIADLCARFSDPSSSIAGLQSRLRCLGRDVRKSGLASSLFQDIRGLSDQSRPTGPWFYCGIECRFVGHKTQVSDGSPQDVQQSERLSIPYSTAEEFLNDCPYKSAFVSLSSPLLANGAKIDYIIPLGLQPVLDFTVDGTHNYLTGGMVNSNSGKTIAGAYMSTVFATGLYPPWWEGRRFDKPTVGWVCNKTAVDVRDINQLELLGFPGQFGTGMIPASHIIQTKPKPSVPDGIEIIYVKHVSGGQSVIYAKSYDQGREKYQGRAIDFVWFDEEVPEEVYSESLMRIMTTNGVIFLTYTPLLGLSRVTTSFLRDSVNKETLPIKFSEEK